jgi:Aminoglycoside-2''-adenylyltransferase
LRTDGAAGCVAALGDLSWGLRVEQDRTPGILQIVPSSTPQGALTKLADVLAVLDLAEESGVRLWVDGGWGADALLGEQTRKHGDLDVPVEPGTLTCSSPP